MSAATPDPVLELLAAEAVGDIDGPERDELDRLLGEDPGLRFELSSMELAVAAAAVAHLGPPARHEPLDDALRQRILGAALEDAEAPLTPAPAPKDAPLRLTGRQDPPMRSSGPIFGVVGWLAAAACLVLAVLAWTGAPNVGGSGSLREARAQLLAEADDAVVIDWQDWALAGEGPEITGVKGDVVWSESRQMGFLRFVGLPANNPSEEQYQLWIVDERGLATEDGRSARISGAIFDAETGETIVPIDPGIPVENAKLFAVTIEKPGGVWVSDMTRRVTVAAKG